MPHKAPSFKLHHSKPTGLAKETKAERDKFYSSAAWMRCRKSFLSLNPLCVHCHKENRIEWANEAHHIIERLVDPSKAFDHSNLLPLCKPCHSKETARRKTSQ